MNSYDVIIIGSGAGGATAARRLAEAGAKVLILERGDYLPREPQNWDAAEVFGKGRYKTTETWLDSRSKPFTPGEYYNVGGKTKVFGGALWRMLPQDFTQTDSPAWPLSYEDMEPYYAQAEQWYKVKKLPHELVISQLAFEMKMHGLNPEYAPVAVDYGEGACIRCSTCDGFPCKLLAKGDAEACGIAPSLATGNVTLKTGVKASRIVRKLSGKVHGTWAGDEFFSAPAVILAAGAVNSAALWLSSGLPDSSGQAGRNYMCHQSQAVLAIGEKYISRGFHKTLRVMDFYDSYGSIQMAGQPLPAMLRGESRLAALMPGVALREIAERSLTFWLMTEDLPCEDNRVTVEGGKIRLSYATSLQGKAYQLYHELAKRLPHMGYPVHLRKSMPLSAVAHQCGTLRMSATADSGVVSPWGEAWEVPGLYVADSSVFPSSSAVNPALTVMANAIRTADNIMEGM